MTTNRYFGKLRSFRAHPVDGQSGRIIFLGRDDRLHRFDCDWEPLKQAFVDMFGGPLWDAVKAATDRDFEYTVKGGRVVTLFPITDETR